ncbi:MAG: pyridoxal-phosphate dependent enzyme, partial [Gemmatimonadota bacterium]
MRAGNHKASLLPDGSAIAAARERLAGVARPTPLARSPWLSERVGVAVHLKLECWQRTHSFKLRGAYNAVAALDPATRRRGLVTASA